MVSEQLREVQGIYVITQLSTGMKYVGKSINIRKRVISHFRGKGQAIQDAIRKFGSDDFRVEARYFPDLSHQDLVDLEYETIKAECSISPGGYNKLGRGVAMVFSEEHRANLSKAWKGRIISQETRLRMSKSAKGKKKSAQTRLSMSKAQGERKFPSKVHDFSNSKTGESFIGTIIELAQKFNLNLGSARRAFYSSIPHKGWVRS